MAARVCDECEIAYPTMITLCRGCGNPSMRYANNATPSDWERESDAVITRRENERRAIPLLKLGAIKDELGRLWIYSVDLIDAGWGSPLASFQLFELLDGSIVEVQGRDEAGRRWWVEAIGPSDGGFK